jgi:hypothetical protein
VAFSLTFSKIKLILKGGDERNILNYRPISILQGKLIDKACHTFLNNIQEAMENKHQVIGLFLDLTKAYDVLNHQILLDKLENGITGLANKWFQSYFIK